MNSRLAVVILATTIAAIAAACGGGGGSSDSNSGSGSGSASGAAATSFDLVASDSGGVNFFEYKGKKEPNLVVKAGSEITVNVTNKGKAIHNMRVAGVDGAFNTGDDFVSKPETINAGGKATLAFKIDKAGSYRFHCDFHPESAGTISVQ